LLIDVIGEVPFFYALYDNPRLVDRLMQVLDQQIGDMLEKCSELQVPYIEFCDNLEGSMTNPRLFMKYVAPSYQRYSQILHAQGKKLGSHTDGNLKKLVPLLPESGLDVCESFTPAPITDCPFEEAWAAWENGPLIWGGIPSSYLEARLPEAEFQERIETILALVRDRPIILGIGDAVMCDNDIERIRWIASRIEDFPV
jgi:uroporphyrinogen-III decarboxylase